MAPQVRAIRWEGPTTVEVFPGTLRILRERLCLQKNDVAARLNRSPSYITRCESTSRGSVTMSGQERADYAVTLRVPAETLSRRFDDVPPEGVHFHTRKLTAQKRRQAAANAALTANTVNTLLAVLDIDKGHRLPQVDVTGMSPMEAGRVAARRVRQAFGLGDSPVADIAGLFERHGVYITRMQDLVAGVRGMTIYLGDGHAPVLFLAPYVSEDVRRQTLAHELGHLVMDHCSGVLSDGEIEERATAFGGEFLAPFTMIASRLEGLSPSQMGTLTDVQREWGVHPGALIQRGYLHGLFTDNQRRNWFQSMNRNKRLIDSRPSSYPIRPTAVGKLAAGAVSLGWSEPHLCDRLGFHPDELAQALDGWPFDHREVRQERHEAPLQLVSATGS